MKTNQAWKRVSWPRLQPFPSKMISLFVQFLSGLWNERFHIVRSIFLCYDMRTTVNKGTVLYLLSLYLISITQVWEEIFNRYFELCLICSFLGNYELLQTMGSLDPFSIRGISVRYNDAWTRFCYWYFLIHK